MDKMNVLVIYDIVDKRRRNALIKILNSYGIRVQKSAFEIKINKKSIMNMVSEIQKIICINEDNVRFYEIIENNYRINIGAVQGEIIELNDIYIL